MLKIKILQLAFNVRYCANSCLTEDDILIIYATTNKVNSVQNIFYAHKTSTNYIMLKETMYLAHRLIKYSMHVTK